MTLRIDIRSKKLRGGRITLDAKTERKVDRNRREAAIRALLEQDELLIVEGIRARKLDIADVQRAHEAKADERKRLLADMRKKVAGLGEGGPYLGDVIDTVVGEAKGSLRPGTAKGYDQYGDRLVEYFGRDFEMSQLVAAEATRFLTTPKETNGGKVWGGGSQRAAHNFAKMVWDRAIEDDADRTDRTGQEPRITKNPWRRAKFAKYRSPRVEFLRPEEWIAVREASRGRAACALLALGARAGLRFGEAAHLRTGIDVDMDRRVIMVRIRSGKHPWRPKSDNGERDVPMADDLFEILSEHIANGYAGRSYLINTAKDLDTPIQHTTAIRWTRTAFKAAGIQYGRKKDALTFHSLRHTFASHLTQAGMHPKKVGRLLGDTAEQVLKTYGHLAEDDHSEATGILNAMVNL